MLWNQVRKGLVKDLNRALKNHGMKMRVFALVRDSLSPHEYQFNFVMFPCRSHDQTTVDSNN